MSNQQDCLPLSLPTGQTNFISRETRLEWSKHNSRDPKEMAGQEAANFSPLPPSNVHSWNPPRNTGPLNFFVVPECYSDFCCSAMMVLSQARSEIIFSCEFCCVA